MIFLKDVFLKEMQTGASSRAEKDYEREQERFGTRREDGLKQPCGRTLKINQFTKLT